MFSVYWWLAIAVLMLVIAIVCAFFGVGRGVFSVFRQRRTKRILAQAAKILREGNLTEGLRIYLLAESKWAWNVHDGHRPSLVQDLEVYTSIASGIFNIIGKSSASVRTDVRGIVAEMKGFLSEHPYFCTDARKTRPELLERWSVMCRRFEEIRQKVRSAANPNF